MRYEITGSGTAFAPNNQTAVDITTDVSGAARVNLVPAQKSTTAQVAIKIIRPSKPDDEAPAMVVGQGWTSVTWSAPDPKVTLTGPASAGVGTTITYRADVSNAGDIVAHRVVASTSVPPNMTFLQSNPPAKVVGNLLTWELNDLPPNSGRTIQILCRPERNATVRFPIKIESADQLQGRPMSAETYVETRVFSSGFDTQDDRSELGANRPACHVRAGDREHRAGTAQQHRDPRPAPGGAGASDGTQQRDREGVGGNRWHRARRAGLRSSWS